MTELDEIIKNVECCDFATEWSQECQFCPYFDEVGLRSNKLKADVLKLLRTQQPRLMTGEDWENNPNVDCTGELPAWIEWSEGRKKDISFSCSDGWATMTKREFDDVLLWGGRCWTSRPTDEQRKAVPWDATF